MVKRRCSGAGGRTGAYWVGYCVLSAVLWDRTAGAARRWVCVVHTCETEQNQNPADGGVTRRGAGCFLAEESRGGDPSAVALFRLEGIALTMPSLK